MLKATCLKFKYNNKIYYQKFKCNWKNVNQQALQFFQLASQKVSKQWIMYNKKLQK